MRATLKLLAESMMANPDEWELGLYLLNEKRGISIFWNSGFMAEIGSIDGRAVSIQIPWPSPVYRAVRYLKEHKLKQALQ